MILDAVVLAGGRSSRLGGTAKARLVIEGSTLVTRTVDAASGARRVVVVGEETVPGTIHAREIPEFGGPAAAIAAGLNALFAADPIRPADRVLVLACDMPLVADVVPALLAAFDENTPHIDTVDGIIAVDPGGRRQYLAGVYSARALRHAVERNRDSLMGLSVRALLEGLTLREIVAPGNSTADIDTWSDAAEFGIERPRLQHTTPQGRETP
jgi:molybdopterin-guanine dinucleotide biosynthesis protein A